MEKNPIPAEYPSWNVFYELHVKNQERLKEIVDGLQQSNEGLTDEQKKLAAYYCAAMNEEAIEAAGVAPLADALALCKEARDTSKRAEVLGKLNLNFDVSSFFSIYASPDKKDSNHSIGQITQAGLGLPDRDYYFDEDKAEKRDLYKVHIAKMMRLLDYNLSEDDST